MATVLSQASSGLTITLPSPDFNNDEKMEFDRINRRTRGGDLVVFRDPEWTHTITLDLKFSWMTQARVHALLAFLKATLGQVITLTDWESYVWTGMVITPGKVAQPGPSNFTAAFSFIGTRR